MPIWGKIFARNRDRPDDMPTGRKTSLGGIRKTLSPRRSRVTDILETLRSINEEIAAIEFLKKVSPDVSMSVWNFVRLANQGHKMHMYDLGEGKNRNIELEEEWRDFTSRINEISNAGLDGLIDQLHHSAFMQGAMGLEVEVNDSRTDIVDVYPVPPKSITWEIEERNGREVWIPYQQQNFKKVSLEKGKANFFWVPTDPDINDPRGVLHLTPVIQAIDFQLEILNDLQAVLHHQGYPRNDISINLERMVASVPPAIKNDPDKLKKHLTEQWENIRSLMQKIDPDEDYLHFDDIAIKMNEGANNSTRGLDVRAIAEVLDIQTLSGAKQMAIFMNRNQGVTESWGTVQFRIFCSGIASCHRGSKRLIEEVARLWLRVKGIQAVPVFEHNMVDWNSEEQRMNVRLMEEEFYAIAQLMHWIDADTAASEVMGAEKAASQEPSESIRASFSIAKGVGDIERNDKRKRNEFQDRVVNFKKR